MATETVIILEEDERMNPGAFQDLKLTDTNRLIIDRAAYIVYHGSDRIAFPKKEFELLLLLASNPKKVFKREDILTVVWGANHRPKDSRSLDVHIRMIRRKLGDAFIATVRGVGYRLEK